MTRIHLFSANNAAISRRGLKTPRLNLAIVLGFLLISVLLMVIQSAVAQVDTFRHTWDVFLQRDIDSSGTDDLIFIDTLTGDEVHVNVLGERYTLIGRSVMYYDPVRRRVMRASPDGHVQPHAFMQPETDSWRIDWIVSADGTRLAWTVTGGADRSSLTTVTRIADSDGTNLREVLTDGPRDSIRALPVAFSADGDTLYMDYQPDGLSDFTPFPQYAGLFALDLESGESAFLPGEPGCFCGAGFTEDTLLRLAITADLSGFDLHVHNIPAQSDRVIPAMLLRNYTQAGGFVIAPSGSQAVYALAQIDDFLTAEQSVQVVYMLVDLVTHTQRSLNEPVTSLLLPVAWTEDNSSLLLTSPQIDGTWKLNIESGRVIQVADATYLGILTPVED